MIPFHQTDSTEKSGFREKVKKIVKNVVFAIFLG
jgi:hypothetical protein